MNQPVDISPHHLKIVTDALKRHLPEGTKVWAFGSRAKWTARDTSDLDLAVEGEKRMGLKVAARLSSELEDSELPYSVDVVDLLDVDENFRKIIEEDKVLVFDHSVKKDKCQGLVKNIDYLPKGWEKRELSDVCEIDWGNTELTKSSYITNGDFLGVSATGCDGRINQFEHEKGVTVMSAIGAKCGKVFYPTEKFTAIKNTITFTPDLKKINDKYLFFLMQENSLPKRGSAQPFISKGDCAKHIILLPPISEQNKIAKILGDLDEKIELDRTINQNLENLAQAIFKSWFVDFDTVHAKKIALESGLSKVKAERAAMAVISGICAPAEFTESLKEMDKQLSEKLSQMSQREQEELAETASLFPSEFEESELGEIPKGWEKGVVADLGDVICGKTPPTKDPDNFNGQYPFITIPDMHHSLINITTKRTISKSGFESSLKGKLLPPGSICVSCIATPGLVTLTTRESFTNQQINSIIPHTKKPYRLFILFAVIQMGSFIGVSGSGGSIFANLSKGKFEKLPILLPNETTIEAFEKTCEAIIKKIFSLKKQTQSLKSIRDVLLPKLLSGEINLKEVSFD